MKNYLIIIYMILPVSLFAQQVTGKITSSEGAALFGANVYWIGTTIGTTTDASGEFALSSEDISDLQLVISYVGFQSETLTVANDKHYNFSLRSSQALETIDVESERPGTFISSIDPIKTEVITSTELGKAACCDLAGCFETQASVTSATTNIVTNTRELRILGLSGTYNQILLNGMFYPQGLNYTYGISTIPGTLVDKIYVAKGANSVLQGYENITGQINVILKDPDAGDRFLFNAYGNSFLESQLNVNASKRWDKLSTMVSMHTTQPAQRIDRDEDGFLDLPLTTRYSLYNVWKYGSADQLGWYTRTSFRYVDESRVGGQVDFNPVTDQGTINHYGQTLALTQPEISTKTGLRLDERHHFVLYASVFHQDQTAYFGTTRYEADHQTFYSNLQYELSWSKSHNLKTGVSYRYENLDETISFGNDMLNRSYDGNYHLTENVPGVFAENTFSWNDDQISLITGIRADHHNQHGWFATPRALFKYSFTENTTARISAGTGWRTVEIFPENINLLASSRDIVITEDLNPEQAINYGANITHKIYGQNTETQLTADFYRTEFSNQIFPDYDSDPTKAYISNFTGTSVSNGFQVESAMTWMEKLELKLAYNYLDVYRVMDGEKTSLPFNSKHRVTGTFSFKPFSKKWHFDSNVHWYSEQRLAKTTGNPVEFQLPESSQAYAVLNAQFTKTWNRLDLYVGCENLFDFRQERPILSSENPFGPYFDTSTVWGPTKGREVYAGIRLKFE